MVSKELSSQPKSSSMSALWAPPRGSVSQTTLAGFVRFVQERTGTELGEDYNAQCFGALHRWSVENADDFWRLLWDYADVLGECDGPVIAAIDEVPYARFFPRAKISYAENMLRHVRTRPSAPAIIAATQDQPQREISWKQLYDQVSLWQQALEDAGVGEGDAVGVYLPNVPEAIIVLLAASNIGAVYVSAGMEMGSDDLINRFAQVQPKILVTADGYTHGKKAISRADIVERAKTEITSIESVVSMPLIEGEAAHGAIDVQDFLGAFDAREIEFIRRDFNHPLYVLFSSGTTGKPKCFEHGTGGVLLKHLSEYLLHCDVHAGDRVFYHATPSWMMYNWLASSLAVGATALMYDGSPAYPEPYVQWDFTARNGCTHHGTAAPLIVGWADQDLKISEKYDLSDLRMVLSTGAVLPAQGFTYIHRDIKQDVKISSISGGTDIVACFMGGNPFTPTYAGQINGPMLGLDVRVWNEDGRDVAPGEAGELVCANVFPSMPLRFLNDEDGARYAAEYFEEYPGQKIWCHGDSVERTLEGQLKIIGRSDATLNQNGVRIGPSVIYDQLEPFKDQISDAVAVDFKRPDNEQAITILFLALQNGADSVPEDLASAIRAAVRNNVTPYAMPTEILAVPDVLKTPNGKKAEIVTKKIINGKDIPNPSLYGEELVALYKEYGNIFSNKYSAPENGLVPEI